MIVIIWEIVEAFKETFKAEIGLSCKILKILISQEKKVSKIVLLLYLVSYFPCPSKFTNKKSFQKADQNWPKPVLLSFLSIFQALGLVGPQGSSLRGPNWWPKLVYAILSCGFDPVPGFSFQSISRQIAANFSNQQCSPVKAARQVGGEADGKTG